jgi:hypothetical protein
MWPGEARPLSSSKLKRMNKEIKNLADDLELKGDKRKAFTAEMKLLVVLMREDDFDQFYAVADVVMQKYS